MHALIITVVCLAVYVGMAVGRLPWLQVDRTGIALLGVIALLASGQATLDDLGATIDMTTIALLFGLMIISAQFVASESSKSAATGCWRKPRARRRCWR